MTKPVSTIQIWRAANRSMRIVVVLSLILSRPAQAGADAVSAAAAMEDTANPLVLINTEAGPIHVELLPGEAPLNVANFLALAEPPRNANPAALAAPSGYYDGMRFHRVIPGLLIQAGSPALHRGGREHATARDEINADALGLDREPVLYADGEFNPLLDIQDRRELEEQLLRPLYRRLGIDDNAQVAARQDEIMSALAAMSVKDAYAQLGYRYQTERPGRGLDRGALALANRGPDDNGPEFFIVLSDAPRLNGKYTVIGRVVEGMAAADRIGAEAVAPPVLEADGFTASGRLIYSIRQVN